MPTITRNTPNTSCIVVAVVNVIIHAPMAVLIKDTTRGTTLIFQLIFLWSLMVIWIPIIVSIAGVSADASGRAITRGRKDIHTIADPKPVIPWTNAPAKAITNTII